MRGSERPKTAHKHTNVNEDNAPQKQAQAPRKLHIFKPRRANRCRHVREILREVLKDLAALEQERWAA